MTCSMADLARRGQPRERWILGGFSCLAILPPGLLRLSVAADAAGHQDRFRAAQESLDEHTSLMAWTNYRVGSSQLMLLTALTERETLQVETALALLEIP